MPNAGRSTFAKVPFKKGHLVCEYRGKIYKKGNELDDFAKENADKQMIYIDGHFIIGYPNDVGACVNDIINFKKYSKSDLKQIILDNHLLMLPNFEYNCIYTMMGNRVVLMATKDIEPGDELFVAYGPDYWKSRMAQKGRL